MRLGKSGCETEKCCTLCRVTAAMHRTRFGIGFGVVCTDKGVKLSEYKDSRSLATRVNFGYESRDSLGVGKLVAELFKLGGKICGGLVFLVARFGVSPYVFVTFVNKLGILFYGIVILFHFKILLYD